MTSRQVGVLLLLGAIWGASFLLIKIALEGMSPVLLAGWRVALAALFLGVLAVVETRRNRQRIWRPDQWRKFLVLAIFNAAIPYILIAMGEQHITSGLAAIFNSVTPLFSFVFGYMVGGRRENLGLGGILGLIVGIGGVVVLVGGGGQGDIGGELAVIVASASYAIAGTYARSAFEGQPILVPALGQNLTAALLLLPLGLVAFRPDRLPPYGPILAVLGLGLAGTGLAYVLYYWLIAKVGSTRTLTVTYLLPVTALVYGAIFLGEPTTWRELLGLALILTGVAGISGVFRRSQVDQERPQSDPAKVS